MRAPRRAALLEFGHRLKIRFVWAFIAGGIASGTALVYRQQIFQWLLVPANGQLSPFEGGPPVFTAPQDMMGITFNLVFKIGGFVAIPVFAVGVYTLLRPGLPMPVRKFIAIVIPATVLCFLAGAAFAYYVMLPRGLVFLLHFGDGVAVPLITVKSYLEMLMSMMFWLGVMFELPLVMYFLSRLGLRSYQQMKTIRKFVPASAFFLGAIITPSFDPVNSTLIALPIIALYEVGLFGAWVARPEDGNYMFLKTFWSVITSPVRALRRIYRMVRR